MASRVDGITVREKGRRRYEVDFSVDLGGGEHYRFRKISPFGTVGESREWGRVRRAALLQRGKETAQPRADPTQPRAMSYWARRYMEDATNPARRDGANAPATVSAKEASLKHLLPELGARRVTAIDRDAIEEYAARKIGAGLAVSYVALQLQHLGGILRHAKTKGCPRERSMDIPRTKLALEERIPQTLSEQQTERVLAAYEGAEPWQLAIVALLFRAGLRIGEVLGLRWGDLDFEVETIRVRRSFGRHGIGKTKGKRARTVPMHWQVARSLARLGAEGWVFASSRTCDRPRSYQSVRVQLAETWDSCGLVDDEGERVRWHTHIGRHSLGRHWATRGWPLRGLQELLGHTDLKTTMIYAHWSRAATGPLLQQLGAKVRTARPRGRDNKAG